ncbi:ABC transporter substrate-binding protein [Pedobacter xixiisoli]|uniref:ABC-type branched-chain amino acid transport system, substrate-binding protein n=1 Tax=Pedobacter xixiisoli TaxID=1476464 RepID=A0A285ZUP6_9SPHI|nr:ABC transporter substrate-binding protein [Pedobacter xixiisoli]SOD13375.1 ABC-type branched-chain amino acid transport system, substrate-binding protein [Pedobacter xixiisoli]
MNKLTVGLLLPVSTIVPMSRDFEQGLKQAIKDQVNQSDWEVELIPEFIGQGGRLKVEEAIDKLFYHYQVDVVAGLVSNMVATAVAPKFERYKKPIIINNIGEHIPNPALFNPYIFINSTHSWQQIWSLGYWAVKAFGNKGMFVASVYDAGYSFSNMLTLGMEAADKESTMPFSIAQVTPGAKTTDPRTVFEHIEMFKPDFVFSAFCGEEATAFQEAYATSAAKNIPLLALPFLLENFDAKENELEIYTAISSTELVSEGESENKVAEQDQTYYQLGKETGMILAEALKIKGERSLTDALNQVKVNSHRGVLHIDAQTPGKENQVHLVKNIHSGNRNNIKREIVGRIETVSIDNKALSDSLQQLSSGWENPYLGI